MLENMLENMFENMLENMIENIFNKRVQCTYQQTSKLIYLNYRKCNLSICIKFIIILYTFKPACLYGGGGTPKNPFLFQNRKISFFTDFFVGFLGLNLKNDVILILYLK